MSVPARARARPYGIAVRGAALRREFQVRGLTATAVARQAKVAQSTVSQALNDHRIHPRKLLAIVAVLTDVRPIPELEKLLEHGDPAVDLSAAIAELGAASAAEHEATRG